MILARVKGTAVASAKVDNLEGRKMLLVELLDATDEGLKNTRKHMVAIDAIGAGEEEIVVIVQGSSARLTPGYKTSPVDAVIVGIVDTVTTRGLACSSVVTQTESVPQ
ncbi:MAG: EutN/CcmL family microcompartment protein [Gemmatimonadetes bacterium]|jgi:ethanolamine utilization protein EutN|nr:EutN/CcmL family microcompartment protein [Gemmatimonadota bacterium]MBT6146660.1 EutN/CcmL family microcompartment protein [Gemmatimonadota bacterium]